VAISPCQSVFDALTDVDMPKRHPTRAARGSIEADGPRLPVYACDALVFGSGAAGWRGGGVAGRRRAETVRNRCRCRHAKSLLRYICVFGIGEADPA
jgi:succinate dehydrogenase / fumarate reductase, flavoprotein subunit